MSQMEKDFLHAIQMKNNAMVVYCLDKGLNANICDEKGTTALEYALKYNPEFLERLAQHPQTKKETIARAIDTLQAECHTNKDIIAFKKWEKETPFFQKIIDMIIGLKALSLSLKAAETTRSLQIKQQILYKEYQKERS